MTEDTNTTEIIELMNELCDNTSIPKNVKFSLECIKNIFNDDSIEIAVKVDSAMQNIEDLSLDPNLSQFARTQIWNLTSLLEGLLK